MIIMKLLLVVFVLMNLLILLLSVFVLDMILCNFCVYFDKKARLCNHLFLEKSQLRIPTKIKDVRCTAFRQPEFYRDVRLSLLNNQFFSYNLKN